MSGGGPGAMEATHVGATFAHASDTDFAGALRALAGQPKLPTLNDILDADGNIAPGRDADIREALRDT